MNFGSIYSQATGKKSKDIDELPLENKEMAALAAERFNWLSSPVTGELLKALANQRDSCIERALGLAENYSEHQNAFRIVQQLQQANTLIKLLQTYGRD